MYNVLRLCPQELMPHEARAHAPLLNELELVSRALLDLNQLLQQLLNVLLLHRSRAMLDLSESEWRPPVELVTAIERDGLDRAWDAIAQHRAFMSESGRLERRRLDRARAELVGLAQRSVVERATRSATQVALIEELSAQIAARTLDPYRALSQLLPNLFN